MIKQHFLFNIITDLNKSFVSPSRFCNCFDFVPLFNSCLHTNWLAITDRRYSRTISLWHLYNLSLSQILCRYLRASNERPYGFAKQKKYKKTPTLLGGHFMCWHLPIFPGRHQPSIFGTTELNFCVRYGNRWTLSVINTNCLIVFSQENNWYYTALNCICQYLF